MHPMRMIGIGVMALAVAACGAARPTGGAPETVDSLAGWYMEHGGEGLFTPCGGQGSRRVTDGGDLAARARRFGLQEDTPIYVRLRATVQADRVIVSQVRQFGSPTPVRDCPLEGVVIPAK